MNKIRTLIPYITGVMSFILAFSLLFINTEWKFWNTDYKLFLIFILAVPPLLLFKKTKYLRAVFLLASLVLFGFLQMSCPRLPGAVEMLIINVISGKSYLMFAIKIGIILFSVLLFSRYYCSWICPKGAIQEMLYQNRYKTNLPDFIDSKLKYVKYIMLILLIIMPLIWKYRLFQHMGPFRVIFNLDGPPIMAAHLFFWLILSVFVERSYCRYFCPEGALFALLSRISLSGTSIKEKGNCISCGKCKKVCPVNAFKIAENNISLSKAECIGCKECETVCPKNAINYNCRL